MTVQNLQQPSQTADRSRKNQVLGLLTSRTVVLAAAALVLILYFHFASGGLFITPTNASLLLRQTAVVAVVASGVAVLIIMGEIDLSIGSAVFLTGLVAAQCQVAGWGVVPSILAAVVVGLGMGLVQGVVITRLAVPAFVVTLAGLLLWRGVGLLWTQAAAIGPVSPEFIALTEGRMPTVVMYLFAAGIVAVGLWRAYTIYAQAKRGGSGERAISVPSLLTPVVAAVATAAVLLWVGTGRAGLPNALFWITAVAVLLGVLLNRAKFGRRTFMVGSNYEAAKYAGINVRRTVLVGFLIMGTIYAIAGTMLTARLGTSTADSGINLELSAIAGAVIGGNSLRGGIGTIRGAILGAFLLSTIDNGMGLLGVSSYAESIVKALILVFAVALDGYFTRRQVAN